MLVSVDLENVSLREALKALQGKTGINFIVHPEVKDAVIVAAHFVDQPVGTVLKLLLAPVEATYEVRKGVFVIYPQPAPAAPPPAAEPSADSSEPEAEESEAAPPAVLPAPRQEPEAEEEPGKDGKAEKAPEIRLITLRYLRPSVAAWLLGGQAIPGEPFISSSPFPTTTQPYYGGYGSYGYNPYGDRRGSWRSRRSYWGNPTAHGTTTTKTWGLFGTHETTTVFGPDGIYTVEGGLSLDPNAARSGLRLGSNGLEFQLGPLHFEAGGARIEFPAGF